MSEPLDRRRFLVAVGAGALSAAAASFAVTRTITAQTQVTGRPETVPEVPGGTMDGDGYLPVRRAAKPGATPQLTAQQRDDLEHMLSCPCPCTLDVFTCRTSMSCGFSPRMHADVQRLVDGGYSADEIVAAFSDVYGQQVLMAPKREGFNLAGYLAPFAAIGAGGLTVAMLIRRWGRRAALARAASTSAPRSTARVEPVNATPAELARLDAAIRGDDDA